MNFFRPVRKVVETERHGAIVRKRFDEAKTPYQRLLAGGVLDEGERKKLREIYQRQWISSVVTRWTAIVR